jgi:hypothetical protein
MRLHNLNQTTLSCWPMQFLENLVKTLENVRDYNKIRLIADPSELRKAVSKSSYGFGEIINDDSTMVQLQKRVKLNQP